MRIPRFYQDNTFVVDHICSLSADNSHYVHNVLRLPIDAPVVLFNGDGNEYSAYICGNKKRSVDVMIDAKLCIDFQSSLPIHLGQAISKGDRMDIALQKSTELGVTEITPIITERCNVKLSPERWNKKHIQWQKLLQAACEQCGRNTLPKLHQPLTMSQWLACSTQKVRIILDPKSEHRLNNLNYSQHGFRLMIGPEGGFTNQEVYTAKQTGYQSISAGPRVLRTETAAVAAVAVLQSMFGDL